MHKARSTQAKPRKNRASVAEITAALLKLKDIPYEPKERLKDTALNARCLFDGNAEAAEAFLDEPNDELGGRVPRQIVGEGLIGYNEVLICCGKSSPPEPKPSLVKPGPKSPWLTWRRRWCAKKDSPESLRSRSSVLLTVDRFFGDNAEAAEALLDEPNNELGGRVLRRMVGESC